MNRGWILAFGRVMPLATGWVSALLAIAVQALGAADLVSCPYPSTPYGEAWGRTSPSGAFQLCRLPETSADVISREYELRCGALLLWRLWLPHALDEAVVSDAGMVDGFAVPEIPDASESPSIAYVVSISRRGVVEREWRIEARKKWFLCGGVEPAVTEIARVDASRIAVRTGYDDLLILDVDAATPERIFDLYRLVGVPGENRRIAEWDVLPGGEVVAVRAACSRYEPGIPTAPPGTRVGSREDFWQRFFVATSDGEVLWSTSEHRLTLPVWSMRSPLEAAAELAFREERTQRITVPADNRFEVLPRAEPTSLWIQVAKDADGAWQVRVAGD